jgi:hypothetical protein
MDLQCDQPGSQAYQGTHQNIGEVMDAGGDTGQDDEGCPDCSEYCQPDRADAPANDSDQHGAGGMTGWEGMGIRIAIDTAPFAFRAAAADEKLDEHDQDGQPEDGGSQQCCPAVPFASHRQPKDEQPGEPEPRVGGMSQQGGRAKPRADAGLQAQAARDDFIPGQDFFEGL